MHTLAQTETKASCARDRCAGVDGAIKTPPPTRRGVTHSNSRAPENPKEGVQVCGIAGWRAAVAGVRNAAPVAGSAFAIGLG